MRDMDISLALGGGGVKGFAHIGVLRVLEQEGFRIRAVAGTSAGGMIGALYAAGYGSDETVERLGGMERGRLYSRLPGDGPALLGMAGVAETLADMLGERTFEDLSIPLAVTAVDLEKGLPVALCRGRLLDAVLATSAVPGVFPPRELDGRLLVDGGVLDPVPVALARSLAPGMPVVAVVLSPSMGWEGEQEACEDGGQHRPAGEPGFLPGMPRLLSALPIYRIAGRLRLAQAFNIFLRSIDVAGILLTDLRLEIEKPEVVVRPSVHSIGLLDQVNVSELSHLGEVAMLDALPVLRRAMSWPARLARRVSRLGDGNKEAARGA
jgi:NTE family protein